MKNQKNYDTIFTFENLYESHRKCRRNKRHKREVIEFESRLSENITILRNRLRSRTYEMSVYYHFTIHEPKKREVYATRYADRMVIRNLCDHVLEPIIGKRLIYDNAACQKNKGTHFALERMSDFLRNHYKEYGNYGYALKCDIHKYFASINHEILMDKLEHVIKDGEVIDLLRHYLVEYKNTTGATEGIPLGNQSSQWYGIYYMDSLDRKIKEVYKVKTQSKLRVKRKFKALAKDYREEKCDMGHVKQVVMSYRGHMMHGDSYKLRKYLFSNLYVDLSEKKEV